MAGDRCEMCRHYARLENPFRYDKEGYMDGVTVFGFCAKDIKRLSSFHPVYVPDGGVCKSFQLCSRIKTETDPKSENQIVLDGVR